MAALAARLAHDPRLAVLADPALARRVLLLVAGLAALATAR